MAVHDASTAVSTCDGDDRKKNGDGGTVFRSGAAIPKTGTPTSRKPKMVLTVVGGSDSLEFSESFLDTATTLVHPLRLQVFENSLRYSLYWRHPDFCKKINSITISCNLSCETECFEIL